MFTLPPIIRPLALRALDAHWRLSCRVGYTPRRTAVEARVGAVLLSYGRPRNIDPILRALLRGDLITRVVVSNNNPDLRSSDFLSVRDDRLTVIDQIDPRGPGLRWDVARSELADMDIVLAIDDDIFAYPSQLERLVSAVIAEPSIPHGMFGQSDDEWIERQDTEVDALCGVYAVTARHVERYHELLERVPDLRSDVDRMADDLVISRTGDGSARIHDLGRVPRCPTSTDPDIALHQRQPDFLETRRRLAAEVGAARQAMQW